jgi:hypothetical protein
MALPHGPGSVRDRQRPRNARTHIKQREMGKLEIELWASDRKRCTVEGAADGRKRKAEASCTSSRRPRADRGRTTLPD